MDDKEIEKYIDEIYNLLGGNVSREEIKKIFDSWLKFQYSPKTIKEKILQKYASMRIMKISEIKDEMSSINVIGKILSLKENEKNGKKFYLGLLGDETGVIPFLLPGNYKINAGDVIKIKNGYVKSFKDVLRIYVGKSGSIEKLSNVEIKIARPQSTFYTIDKLKVGMKNIEIKGRVINLKISTVKSKNIYRGVIADSTGGIHFTSFGLELKENNNYRISNAFVREYKGRQDLIINENSIVEQIKEDIDIFIKKVSMEEALERNLPYAPFEGILVDVMDSTGIVARCPKCGIILKGRECPTHGEVEPINDIIAKVVFDDGSLASLMMIESVGLEKLLSKTKDEIMKDILKTPGLPVLKEEIEDKMLMKPFETYCKIVKKDSNRIVLYPYIFKFLVEKDLDDMENALRGEL
ncbi:MAG: hypothetical protein ACP5JT_05715 [Thermoplasmata archaeon]|jgi:replication factor A1